MELALKRFKRRIYMRAYRKREYVKKKTHEYYLSRIIKLSLADTERTKKFLNEKIRAI